MSVKFEPGQRIRIPGRGGFLTVDDARCIGNVWRLYVANDLGDIQRVELTAEQTQAVELLDRDGTAASTKVLAALWAEWMKAATVEAKATTLASTPLRPYAHQNNAVYGAMLPQPRLRFLLADEPGTGKTIMAGLYLREMQRLGFIRRALIVVPAHLVSKWQGDFTRFFGGGLKRIRATTVQEGALSADHDLWIVSLDLAAVNPAIQEAIRPDLAGWDVVVFDEAHRLTPTAQAYYRVGQMLCLHTPRVLLMTATPHRGKEWLFRSLMHLTDPEVFPAVDPGEDSARQIRPGPVHFLRRMKEDLLDYDGVTPLFKGRLAQNVPVALNSTEAAYYLQALSLVDRYFPPESVPLAKMVYGKRAASSLFALCQTLRRRQEKMGTAMPVAAVMNEDPDFEDPGSRDEARVIVEQSRAARAERDELKRVLGQLEATLANPNTPVSKWPRVVTDCLQGNGILPGNREQCVVFTEYADTADWLVRRFRSCGFSTERYSGRDVQEDRDQVRERFANRDFQVLVSTDAGNEGIDLQTAHVLVNWDIPWSLVRLEQRMGRIHRIGQLRDVKLYNVVATDTREGEVLRVLLDNFVIAANRLDGKLFDSLSLVAELLDLDVDRLLSQTYDDDPTKAAEALSAARAVSVARVEAAARRAAAQENALKSAVDIASAVAALQRESLERINPRIVEAFLKRLASTGVYTVAPHAGGNELFLLSRPDGHFLPLEIVRGNQALVATSGRAVTEGLAAGADVSHAISLGPSEPSFRALVKSAQVEFEADLFRGGTLLDQTSVTDYDLFAYNSEIIEAGGKRQTVWPFLVRVDETGARPIRWEILANLRTSDSLRGRIHPARQMDGEERANQIVAAEEQRRAHVLEEWLQSAEHELERLPAALTADIKEGEARRFERKRIEGAVSKRISDLRRMAEVKLSHPRMVGWVHIVGSKEHPDPKAADSEMIAMKLAAVDLRRDGLAVADIHLEGRGYDLYATRGRSQRCVEVKGVWGAASSTGIDLTGNELLIAKQIDDDYWLYVIDQCSDGVGRIYGRFQNPAERFRSFMQDVAVVRIPGSALKSAAHECASE
jgi:superfamily II DNA or RNA helicase